MQNKVEAFVPGHSAKKAVNYLQPARVVFLFVLTVAAVASLVTASYATGNINKGDLA
jgi:hypothetical protein